MTPSDPKYAPTPKPGGDPHAYYAGWLRELKELHAAGIVDDEDYAYQRAEKLAELLDCPRRPWLAWLYAGVPAALIAALVSWKSLESIEVSASLLGVALLCGLAALGRRSRERFAHLDSAARLEILRSLLADDVVTAVEFSDYEERLITRKQERFGV